MSRTSLNFILDSGLLVVFTGLVWSSAVVRFVFPPAYESKGWQLWGLGFDAWMILQFAMLSLLALGVLIHVMLHWSWVCGVITSRLSRGKKGKLDDGVQTLYGVGLLIVILNILGLAIAAAAVAIQEPH
jgi:hypothetical protein